MSDYGNNCCMATADCGCEIILSRCPLKEGLPESKNWLKPCKEHGGLRGQTKKAIVLDDADFKRTEPLELIIGLAVAKKGFKPAIEFMPITDGKTTLQIPVGSEEVWSYDEIEEKMAEHAKSLRMDPL